MTLRTKLPLYSSLILFFTIVTLSGLFFYNYSRTVNRYIKEYRQEQTQLVVNHLKDIINIAYRMIDASYHISQEAMKKYYGFQFDTIPEDIAKMIEVNMLKITLTQLRSIRYGKDGYLWINEFDPPYTVIMHGTRPELEGKAWNFYIQGTDINVYKAFHDSIVAGGGEGRVSYSFYKPGTNEEVPKISWVKLYKPLRWVIGTGVYVDEIDKMVKQKQLALRQSLRQMGITIVLITLIVLVVSTFILYLLARSITTPIFKVQKTLEEMSLGKLVEPPDIHRRDEIGLMTQALEKLIKGLRSYADFAKQIGQGNFDAEFQPLSKFDVLGNELLVMKHRLLQAREKERQQLELEKRRHWVSTGVSMFSSLITANSHDLNLLCSVTLNKLMEYVEAAVGGIFLLRFPESDGKRPYLQQIATVAYNRERFINRKIDITEGLVGACFAEKEPIYITNVPENYIQIRTGLGGALPRNIYLTPIKYEEKIFGVIELATFEVFDEFHRSLIDTVAQTLAVALSTNEYYIGKEINIDAWI